jgi:vitamin B12 transport system substrate-binding protein
VKSYLAILVLLVSPVIMAEPAKRIIALSPHAVEMLYAIGAGDRIVATVEYADYPSEALDIPRIGSYAGLQIERVVEFQPDLIVAWKSGNKLADLNKLKSLGLNLVYTLPKTVSEIADDLIRLGELTGNQAQARQVAQDILAEYQRIKSRYAGKEKVRVFYQLWHDPLRTVGPESWIDSLIQDCNGHNIFDDTDAQYPLVSFESVLVKDPQVIIIPHHSGEIGAKQEVWRDWHNVSAIKARQLFTIDGDVLHRFSPRAIQGLSEMCEAIDKARG